jgi:RNA polymerase sigma factor (sigma-70 family)
MTACEPGAACCVVARKSGLSDADSQDVVQDTVIAVARKMPEFRYDPAKGSFKMWLLLITRRRIQDHLRRVYRSSRIGSSDRETAQRELENLASDSLPPDAAIDATWESEWHENLFQAALQRVRQRVNPKQYQVFDYCVLQRVPAREVARMLGLTAAQIYLAKHRISRAVHKMAAELEAEVNRGRWFRS